MEDCLDLSEWAEGNALKKKSRRANAHARRIRNGKAGDVISPAWGI